MTLQVTHALWLNDSAVCSIEHLVEVSGLPREEIEDLVENGLMDPVDEAARSFHLLHVVTVRQARRLRDDFQLDRNGLALAMTLLRRIASLEQALLAAQSRHPIALLPKEKLP
ncbi:chaperone modulator CbpM [Massilia sp. DJPM01]|uniref:chaperone modulator CbpM n=1 Tax=Massilia sp. DJPM01 TaxID=3024404 RepID=UPI00259F8C9E|nr:chaperone modulator CbpM [Massilia sp. DJPM01]MDM5180056.1 chaperone modulator CbpM [Massilia sp. DJPM01]